jgi:hypothetical protein
MFKYKKKNDRQSKRKTVFNIGIGLRNIVHHSSYRGIKNPFLHIAFVESIFIIVRISK